MISQTKFLGISVFIVLVSLTGCARYCAHPLNRLPNDVSTFEQKQAISFSYKIFSSSDCKRFLDRNVINKGYRPIHITITNSSDRFLYISRSQFSFPCAPYRNVAEKVHSSTAKRAVGYGIVGLFIWPFLVPALVDGLGSAEANKKLDFDFKHKSLKNQIITPFSTINGLIFVPVESFNPEFGFVLIDNETHERFAVTTSNALVEF